MPRDPKDTSVTSNERIQRRLAESKDIGEPAYRRSGSGASGAEGKEGKPGATWYSGTTVPSTGLGAVGDFYFRTTTSDVYKKTGEAIWSFQVNIKGETGATGTTGSEGKEGKEGKEGPAGATGPPGKSSGLSYKFLTNTESTNPGSGKVKFNNASFASVTIVNISETDINSAVVATWLASWDDSTSTTNRGTIIVRSLTNVNKIAIFSVTGALTDNGEWDAIPVTPIGISGSLPSNEEEVDVTFLRTGDKGAQGEAGKEGPSGSATMNGFKEPVRAATTANIAIATALNPGDVLDGVTLAENDRVLVKNQTTTKENGIWIVKASPARTTDADAAGELRGGTLVYVEEGTVNADRVFKIITNGSITPGTTSHEWAPLEPREIYGNVTSAGAKTNGSAGWTVAKIGTGTYKITITNAATLNPPVPTFTPVTTTTIPVFTLGEVTATSIEVRIWNFAGGVAVDCAFAFEAKLE